MVKDYFQDITPPQQSSERRSVPVRASREGEQETGDDTFTDAAPAPEKSIRNISAPTRLRAREAIGRDPYEYPDARRRGKGRRLFLWAAAGLSVVVLALFALLSFRSTVITVTPRTQGVTFDAASVYTAYPATSAASGTLAYSVETLVLEDSEIVQASGTVRAEDKASGIVTVYNSYSAAPVRLIKNTRFEGPGGLMYRTPADILVPGKRGATAGEVQVTIIADQPGEKYNVGPVEKLTVPGLKATQDMYAGVYAKAGSGFSGGFVGQKPGVAEANLQGAKASMRTRLEAKIRESVDAERAKGAIALHDLVSVTYQDLPVTLETNGGARIHQKAIVNIPVFPESGFASAVAQSIAADAPASGISLLPDEGFAARPATTTASVGTDSLQFTMVGSATLVWDVDPAALAAALAGKDQGSFQNIIASFAGIQEAHARIEPFWSSTFPADPLAIKITVEQPAKAQ